MGVTRKTLTANQTKHPEPNNVQNAISKKPQTAATTEQKPIKPRDPQEWRTLKKKNADTPQREEISPSPQVPSSFSPNLNKANDSTDEDCVESDMDDYYESLKRALSSSENDSSEVKARRLEDRPHSQTHNGRKSRLSSECRTTGQEKDRLSGRSKHSEERNQQHEGKNREEKETRQQTQNQRQPKDKKIEEN